MTSPTLTIDHDSDPGSYADAIAHTPHLARQCEEATPAQIVAELGRAKCLFQARAIASVIHGSPIAANPTTATPDARTQSLTGAGVPSSPEQSA